VSELPIGRISFSSSRKASDHPNLAYPKPEPPARTTRRATDDLMAHASRVRSEVMARDGWTCRICRRTQFVELAHLEPKGMGGDHGIRTTRANCIAACALCHRGPRPSLHAGGITWELLSERGADGPVRFVVLSTPPGQGVT